MKLLEVLLKGLLKLGEISLVLFALLLAIALAACGIDPSEYEEI